MGTASDIKQPECGCDRVTYWNASVAAASAMSIASTGACTNGRFCGGLLPLPCPGSAFCNVQDNSVAICNVSDVSGECWALPPTCPQIVIGPSSRACFSSTCVDECTLIKRGATWYVDNTCPQ